MRQTMSAATESLAQKWLRQNIQAYAFKDAVYAHVNAVLSQFSAIRPKTDVYTYDDGRTQLLLCLHGLLPIAYRGTSYNIPIALWLSRDYPRQPPITYVVPTSDMLVRSSKFVDVSGRCSLDYLQNWERKSEGCNLTTLLEMMQQHFSREPPVYAKPKTADPPQSRPQSQPQHPGAANAAYAARPPPPLPDTRTSTPLSHSAPMSPARNDDRPPLPLKPGQQATPPVLTNTSTSSDVNHRPPLVLGTSVQPPPLPPLPASDPNLPQYRNSPAPLPPYNTIHDRTVSGGAPIASLNATSDVQSHAGWALNPPTRTMSSDVGQSRPSMPPYYPPSNATLPLAAAPTTRPPPPPPPAVSVSQGLPHPPLPPHPPATSFSGTSQSISPPVIPSPPPLNYVGAISPQATGSIPGHVMPPWSSTPTAARTSAPIPPPPPSIPPPDLLDAEDGLTAPSIPHSPVPAPPRPPNPELLRLHDSVHAKLSSELASLRQVMALDAERLRANQTDLLAGEPAIRDEMARLEAVRDVCKGVGGRMKEVVDEAEKNVAELKRRGDPSVDELVCSTTIVHDQLINLVAEDNAIEDTIYHLHRALNAGRIDLERFLRTARVLAEEQFMKRALIEKIHSGIPMGSETSLHTIMRS